MIGTKVWLNEYADAPADGLVWLWTFPGQDDYALRSSDGRWELTRGHDDSAAVTVLATPERWATFLTSPRARRRLPSKDIGLEGSTAEIERFADAFHAKLAPASRSKR
jgi:hypothetical protein